MMHKVAIFPVVMLLLIPITGCKEQYVSLTVAHTFSVDGVKYYAFRMDSIGTAGRSSSLWVCPSSEKGNLVLNKEIASQQGTTNRTMTINGKTIVPQNFTVYFVHENKIAFEKSYQDLSIDTSKLNSDHESQRNYLQPILEKLIRENVPHEATP